ncbi:T9SS C-terminal target domain-containing protein [Emticicia sp. C21]|nr:T9SS C-terminal target domain-containing protein [Emticicia sp. C21]
MWVDGVKDGCPDTQYEYIVYDFPSWGDFAVEVSIGNTLVSLESINSTTKKFKVKYGNSTDFNAWVNVMVKVLGVTVDNTDFFVHLSVSSPSSPNGGTILVCPNGANVNLTTNAYMNCLFHCDYIWTAPSGVNLKYGAFQGNSIRVLPQHQPVELLASGIPTGYLGLLSVAAKWSECGLAGDTYGYAEVYSGPPVLDPKVNGSPSQGYDCTTGDAILTVNYQPGTTSVNWSVIAGTGTITPNGAICYATPNNFLLIKVREENACGATEHFYYLSQCGSRSYQIYPNPSETDITIDFDNKEFAQGLLNKIDLLDLKGNMVYSVQFKDEKDKAYFKNNKSLKIDTKKFKRGNYVLHLDFGKYIDKEQIILN